MAERSFEKEIGTLQKRHGEVFEGEGILADVKGLLQSGVSYIGGYQGAPISHAIDVLKDANQILDDLGIQIEFSGNEAVAAAMLPRHVTIFLSPVGKAALRSVPQLLHLAAALPASELSFTNVHFMHGHAPRMAPDSSTWFLPPPRAPWISPTQTALTRAQGMTPRAPALAQPTPMAMDYQTCSSVGSERTPGAPTQARCGS